MMCFSPRQGTWEEMQIWRFRSVKFCFVWAGVVSFELVHPELNWFPCVSLSSSARCRVWIGLRFWNQALTHLPSAFPSELLSELSCKVNLIHANMSSIISCSAKRPFRATWLHYSHAFTVFPLHSLVLPWFLCKLTGHLVQEVAHTHLKHTSPSHSPVPAAHLFPIVYWSALPALSCCVFHSWHLGLVPASRQQGLCIIYSIATRKWRRGWSSKEANSGECDGNPKQQCFQLNPPSLTKALEMPACAQYFADNIQPKLLSRVNLSMRKMLLVACSIIQEPCLQDHISQAFYWQSCSLLSKCFIWVISTISHGWG